MNSLLSPLSVRNLNFNKEEFRIHYKPLPQKFKSSKNKSYLKMLGDEAQEKTNTRPVTSGFSAFFPRERSQPEMTLTLPSPRIKRTSMDGSDMIKKTIQVSYREPSQIYFNNETPSMRNIYTPSENKRISTANSDALKFKNMASSRSPEARLMGMSNSTTFFKAPLSRPVTRSKVDKVLEKVRKRTEVVKDEIKPIEVSDYDLPVITDTLNYNEKIDIAYQHLTKRRNICPNDINNLSIADLTNKLKLYRIEIQKNKFKKIPESETVGSDSPAKMNKLKTRTFSTDDIVKDRYQRFCYSFLYAMKRMESLNLTIEEIIEKQVFPRKAFERPGSRGFFRAVKQGDHKKIFEYLRFTKYYVYDYDDLKETALHWAAKRGFARIVWLLLESGADPNAKDISGRSPLFLASMNSKMLCVRILINNGANPMVRSEGGRLPSEYATDPEIKAMIVKAYKIYVILSVCSIKKQKEVWKNLKAEFEITYNDLDE